MSKRILERYWKGPCDLGDHEVVSGVLKEIRRDICAGHVFPALRENEIHLYHGGGRVLRIRPQSAYSHGQYACGFGTGDVALERLTKAKYEDLKTRCCEHNSKRLTSSRHGCRETWIVSRLFRRFSVWADGADPDQPRLIDVEVRLRRGSGGSAEMVDLLFLDNDARLTFVEVKRQYDGRVRSRCAEREPKVVGQVRSYEAALKQHEDSVLCAYRDAGSVLGRALGVESKQFEAPKSVFSRVPVLVCRKDGHTGHDRWLQARLAECARGEVNPSYLVVDGGAVGDAETAYRGNPPVWCKNGRWESLDLKILFAKFCGVQRSAQTEGPPPRD